MSFFPPVVFEIQAKAGEAIAEFKAVNAEMEKMQKSGAIASGAIGKMEMAAKVAKVAIVGITGAIAVMGVTSLEAAMKVEKSQANLKTAIEDAGVSFKTAQPFIESAGKSMANFGFTTDDTYAALAKMTAALGSPKEALDSLNVAADLARFKNMSLTEASNLLSRASTGQAKGLADLGIKMGVTIAKGASYADILDMIEKKARGAASAYGETLAGKLDIAKAKFEELQIAVGEKLVPIAIKFTDWVTKTALPQLEKLFKYISDNIDTIKTLGIAIGAIWVGSKITTFVSTAVTGIKTLIQIYKDLAVAATAAAAAEKEAWLAKLGPIGAFVGLTAFISSTTPKKALGTVTQKDYDIAQGLAKQYGATSPLKPEDILHNPTDVWDGEKWVPAPKVGGVSMGRTRTSISGIGQDRVPPKVTGGTKPMTNAQILSTLKSLHNSMEDAQNSYEEKMFKLQRTYDQKSASIYLAEKQKNQDAQDKFNDYSLNQVQLMHERESKLINEYASKDAADNKRFNDDKAKEDKRYADELAQLSLDNANKVISINQTGADKLAAIVKKSVDGLRSAFASGTSANIGTIFSDLLSKTNDLSSTLINQVKNGVTASVSWWGTAAGTGMDSMLNTLKSKLAAAKELQSNAAALQGAGFSQTFIEQVVSQGPEVGNKLAKSILAGSPQTIGELQSLYSELEKTSAHGVDAIANAMSTPGKLATEALNAEYVQAQQDLANNLSIQNAAYEQASKDAMARNAENMAAITQIRDEALAQNAEDLKKALADSYETMTVNIGLADKARLEAFANNHQDLVDALSAAQDSLTTAQNDAKKSLEDSLDKIARTFEDKLGGVKSTVKSTTTAILAMKEALAGSYSQTYQAGGIIDVGQGATGRTASEYGKAPAAAPTPSINVAVTANSNADPASIATATVNAFKYNIPIYAGSNWTSGL
jgi:hypothetical protein